MAAINIYNQLRRRICFYNFFFIFVHLFDNCSNRFNNMFDTIMIVYLAIFLRKNLKYFFAFSISMIST